MTKGAQARSVRASWLIPVRNGDLWLHGAVQSALAECSDRDEVLVIDDGSARPVADWLPRRPRLHIHRQPPRGLVAALEWGRSLAKGAWILRLDADDEAVPGRLEAQVAALCGQARLAAVGGRAELLGDWSAAAGMRHYIDWIHAQRDLGLGLLVESPIFHPAAALRASAVEAVGGYREGPFPEDYDLWLRLVAAGWQLANLEIPVVRLRDHDRRLTRTDARYDRAAFEALKRDHLDRTRLRIPRRIALWAGAKGTRTWVPWFESKGHQLVALIDPFEVGRQRAGRVVEDLAAIECLPPDTLLCAAVGRRGARAAIRAAIASTRPEWREGRDWLALA